VCVKVSWSCKKLKQLKVQQLKGLRVGVKVANSAITGTNPYY